MRSWKIAAIAVLALAVLLGGTGCRRVRLEDQPGAKTFTESKVVALDGATGLTADITQGVGELRLHGDSNATSGTVGDFRGGFTFAPESWRPEVTYSAEGSQGVLTVRQPDSSGTPAFRDVKYAWDLTMPAGVPTRLDLKLGVGTSDVDLRGIDLASLDVLTGVGETTIDLSEPIDHDLAATIEAGIGKLTLRLPRDVGVKVIGRKDGVGDFNADGFIADGNAWVNEAYTKNAGPRITIDLVRGIGDVTLVSVP